MPGGGAWAWGWAVWVAGWGRRVKLSRAEVMYSTSYLKVDTSTFVINKDIL